jgi:hypothetical protein
MEDRLTCGHGSNERREEIGASNVSPCLVRASRSEYVSPLWRRRFCLAGPSDARLGALQAATYVALLFCYPVLRTGSEMFRVSTNTPQAMLLQRARSKMQALIELCKTRKIARFTISSAYGAGATT